MLKKFYATLIVALAAGTVAFAQLGTLMGKVSDSQSGEGLSFANVQLESEGNAVAKTIADIDGKFTIKAVQPGKYDLKIVAVGYKTIKTTGIIISSDKTSYQNDLKAETTAEMKDEVVITEYVVPLIDPDTKTGGTVTREQFEAMPDKNINSVASTTAGVFQADGGGALSIRGGRQNTSGPDGGSTKYYIDGVPARSTSGLPQGDIEQISVITGGVPAQYGDATGGVVNITTRGGIHPDYYGGVELITSQLTDHYGKNFVGFNVGGPLMSKRDSTGKHPNLGFFISGEVNSEKDATPSASGTYKVNDEKLAEIEQHPLRLNDAKTFLVPSADYITNADLQHIKARQNVKNTNARFGGKLDYKANENIMLTLGGSMDYANYHSFVYEYSLLNPSNNPQGIYNNMRIYGKITHKLGKQHSRDEKTSSFISNAYYTLQISYSKFKQTSQDDTHKDNFFDYGYVGKFQTLRAPYYAEVRDSATAPNVNYYNQVSWQDTTVLFTPGTQNPLASNYTSDYYSLMGTPTSKTAIQPMGLLNGDRPSSPYNLWYGTGRQSNGYSNAQNSQFRINGTFSADLKSHAIQAGFEYEKLSERSWQIAPMGLWSQGRQLTNKHLDRLSDKDSTLDPNYMALHGGINAYTHPYLYDSLAQTAQSQFDKSLRSSLGVANNQWIDFDALEPSQLSLDMFSADELLNNGSSLVSYYGYSYTNQKLMGTKFDMNALERFYKGGVSTGNFKFDNSGRDANNNFARDIPAFQPVYVAGYIQDKFDIQDMKFNIGLRIDAFNDNEPVLKDKYLLYETYTVSEDTKIFPANTQSHPSNMGSDYVVYVDNAKNPTKVVGYRNGDKWYNEKGIRVADPVLIANASQSGAITPMLKYPRENFLDSSAVGNIFEMYKTQVTLSPRIAFAFPISDRANFFFHYDILTQRPPGAVRFDPTNYLYIQSLYGSAIGNPGLKSERTVDYQAGFTQVLNERKNSSLTISAFYRQMKDMLTIVNVYQAYPVTYQTYGNLDFGNVKGLTVAYDLRRTQSSQLTASYTLQFAEATGSAAGSAANVISSGQPNLRTTHPLDFDQRHAIVLNYDYRFGSGKDYRGPQAKWAKKIFENLGGNLIFRVGSGLPYSRMANQGYSGNGNGGTAVIFGLNQGPTLQGDINGSNMPWQYRTDLRIDKNFLLKWGNGTDEKAKTSNLTVYVQILNVLNTKNVLDVYRHTGDPKDDGYLSYPGNQSFINASANPQSFVDLYNAKLANPGFYSIPRRTRIGVVLSF